MTDIDIRNAIKKKYSDNRQYAICEEVGVTTGGACRRLDMIIIDCYHSNGFRIDGIEIKVSTSDLRRELEDPEKHNIFYKNLDYFTLACPANVVNPLIDIIPKKWGVLIVNEDGSTRYKRKPLALHDEKVPITKGFLASLVRSILSNSPYDAELRKQYDEGFKKGKESVENKNKYYQETIKKNADKIDKYDNLMYELRLYNTDVNKALEDFKAFRRLRLDYVTETIENLKSNLDRVTDVLSAVTSDGGKK